MKLENLEKLFIHDLKDLHSAEHQILDALPRMMQESSDDQLRSILQRHREETEKQVDRLERIFDELGEDPGGQLCEGMQGLIEEGEEILEEDADPTVRDAGIIAAVQRVEHYEISGYGTAATYANMLDREEAGRLLQETLNEEKQADEKLTELAERTVNPKARTGAS